MTLRDDLVALGPPPQLASPGLEHREWGGNAEHLLFVHYTALLALASKDAGEAVADAYLHEVIDDSGEESLALSFFADSFPFEGVGGFKSLGHKPLYTNTPNPPTRRPGGEGKSEGESK